MNENVAEALQAAQQQLHQRTVIEDPANAVMASVDRGEIALFEQNAGVGPTVAQIKVAEGNQGFFQIVPNSERRQQSSAGMGDGVGPTSLLKFSCRQRVKQDNTLTFKAKGKSCEGTGGTSAQNMDFRMGCSHSESLASHPIAA